MKKLSIAIPSTVLDVEPSLLLKTLRIYQFIRYSSIYGVKELAIYNDGFIDNVLHNRYVTLFRKISRYLLTPPYLRRKLVPLDNDLRYVGVLPPLRLEIYDVSRRGRIGEKRIGYIVDHVKGLVDIGLSKTFRLINKCREHGNYVYVCIKNMHPPIVECLDTKPYMGPSLVFYESFSRVIEEYRGREYLLIATSRYGSIPTYRELTSILDVYDKILVLFGAPRRGLYEIAEKNGYVLEEIVDYIWNTIPGQRVKTIRTEEALLSTLAIFNLSRKHV